MSRGWGQDRQTDVWSSGLAASCGSGLEGSMSDQVWLTEEQVERLRLLVG